MSEPGAVLDASALLAMILDEPGSAAVETRLADACISAVNLSEVVAKLAERGVPAAVIEDSIADLDLDIRPFDAEQARRAGMLRPATLAWRSRLPGAGGDAGRGRGDC